MKWQSYFGNFEHNHTWEEKWMKLHLGCLMHCILWTGICKVSLANDVWILFEIVHGFPVAETFMYFDATSG